MDKHYDPALIEQKWYAWWEQNGCFTDSADRGGEPVAVGIGEDGSLPADRA